MPWLETARMDQHRGEALGRGGEAPLDELALVGQDAHLALALVQIKPNTVHGGWPPRGAATPSGV